MFELVTLMMIITMVIHHTKQCVVLKDQQPCVGLVFLACHLLEGPHVDVFLLFAPCGIPRGFLPVLNTAH